MKIPSLDRRGQGGDARTGGTARGGADVHDELLDELARGLADLLVQGDPGERVDLDELDLHRREPELMDIGDAITESTTLAGKWDPCGSEPNHN